MSMRISSAGLLAFCLAGCGSSAEQTLGAAEADQRAVRAEKGEIICAQAGSPDFARRCTVDRETSDAGLILTLRHPDGGFHRLLVTKDGRGVVAADGAERAVVTVLGKDEIEVALGGDRYRLPATVGTSAPTP